MQGTFEYCICYYRKNFKGPIFSGYIESHGLKLGKDAYKRRSTRLYVFQLFDGAVSMMSK